MHHHRYRPARLLPLLFLALPEPPAAAARNARRRRRRGRRPSASSRVATRLADGNADEALRERWAALLSLDDRTTNRVRSENGRERQYYYEAELLADRLLGLDDAHDSRGASSLQTGVLRRDSSLLSRELSILWKAVAVASSGILIGIPLAALFGALLSSQLARTFLASVQSSVTPYLLPTADVVSSSVRNALLQAQAVAHSLPYFLKHLNRIKVRPFPFLWKLIRKCLILEAWRHIWVRLYKLSRYLWRGTLRNAKAAYVKACPAFVRRGIKSMFQSMVQAHVHGVVGGALGSALGGVTFEGWAWSSGGGGGGGEGLSEMAEESIDGAVASQSVSEAVSESVSEAAAQGMETAVQDALDSVVSVEGAADAVADAISEGAEAAVEEAVETIAEGAMDGLAGGVEEAVEALVDDCLSEGCLDEVVESVLSE